MVNRPGRSKFGKLTHRMLLAVGMYCGIALGLSGCGKSSPPAPVVVEEATVTELPSLEGNASDMPAEAAESGTETPSQQELQIKGLTTVAVQTMINQISDDNGVSKPYLYVGVNVYGYPAIGVRPIRLNSIKTDAGELKVDEKLSIQPPFNLESNLFSSDAGYFWFPLPENTTKVKISQVTFTVPLLQGTEHKLNLADLREVVTAGVTDPDLKTAGLKVMKDEVSGPHSFLITIGEGYALKQLRMANKKAVFTPILGERLFDDLPKDALHAPQRVTFPDDAEEFPAQGSYFSNIRISDETATFKNLVATVPQ